MPTTALKNAKQELHWLTQWPTYLSWQSTTEPSSACHHAIAPPQSVPVHPKQSVCRQAWFLMLQEQINGLTYRDPSWHVATTLLDFWTSPPDGVPMGRDSPVVCKGRAERVFTYALFSLWHSVSEVASSCWSLNVWQLRQTNKALENYLKIPLIWLIPFCIWH